jgi:hypothetical protein
MKKVLVTLFVTMHLSAVVSFSQTVEEMKTPASPGFILMDQTPTSVARPSTPKGLAFNMLNLVQGGAIEVAPFWLYRHKGLTFDKFIDIKFPLYSHLSFSAAAVKKNDSTQIAVGVRTHLLHLRNKKLRTETARVSAEIINLLNQLIPIEDSMTCTEREAAEASNKPFQSGIDRNRKALAKLYQATLQVEIAASYLGISPGYGSLSHLDKSRSGAWLTLSYKPSFKSPFEIIGVMRYLDNPTFSGYDKQTQLVDLGGRALYPVNKWGFSLEYINRQVVKGNFKSYDRLAGIVEFKISNDLFLTGTYGKNFDEVNSVIALLGINFGISKQDIIK